MSRYIYKKPSILENVLVLLFYDILGSDEGAVFGTLITNASRSSKTEGIKFCLTGADRFLCINF